MLWLIPTFSSNSCALSWSTVIPAVLGTKNILGLRKVAGVAKQRVAALAASDPHWRSQARGWLEDLVEICQNLSWTSGLCGLNESTLWYSFTSFFVLLLLLVVYFYQDFNYFMALKYKSSVWMYIQHKHSNTALVSPGKSVCTSPCCLQGNKQNTLEISDILSSKCVDIGTAKHLRGCL